MMIFRGTQYTPCSLRPVNIMEIPSYFYSHFKNKHADGYELHKHSSCVDIVLILIGLLVDERVVFPVCILLFFRDLPTPGT